MTKNMIHILIVDDYAVVRAGLRALLESEPDMLVVGEAEDGETAVSQARLLKPDVILLDLVLPDFDGLHVIQAIRLENAKVPILVLSNYSEPERMKTVLAAGADGYLLKDRHFREVVTAVRGLASGRATLADKDDAK
jgi:DNA-binding NarL/FixJ family response regulator